MKAALIAILLFLFAELPAVKSQQLDSCTPNNIKLKNQLPFDPTLYNCQTVWGAQNFILRYSQTGQKEWSFVLSAPVAGSYIAIGFSPDGNMKGSSAIVGWVGSNGGAGMQKYFLGGQKPNLVVPGQGNLILGNLSSTVVLSGNTFVAFRLIVDKPATRLIYSVGQPGQLPAGPGFQLTEHMDKISTVLNYQTGLSETQNQTPYERLRKSHGILNMLGWGILMPMGVMVARYLKQWDPIWFYSHVAIQSLGFVMGSVGVVCGLILNDRLKNNVDKHKGLGVAVLVLGCLQVIAILARPEKGSKVRKYWNWYHHTVGRFVILLAAANVFYGIHLGNAGTGWKAGYAVAIVVLAIVTVVLELRIFMKK